jgi:hypothetical protein
MWYYIFYRLPHKKDEAIAMDIAYVDNLPIPPPTARQFDSATRLARRLIEISSKRNNTQHEILD